MKSPIPSLSVLLASAGLLLFPPSARAEAPATQPAHQHEHAAHQADKVGAPLFNDLGDHQHKITTSSPQAQRFFDQGLTLVYAFNHDEAIRSFQEAARLDPQCAMAYWGIAYAYGPNINQPMTEEAVPKAWEALQQAMQRAGQVSEQERAYIEALAKRYAKEPVKDRSELDKAYADAMHEVARRYPDDLDAQALAAEAIMDTMPWEYYTKDGQPKPATVEVVAMLEQVLARDPTHPGANHYYIHAVEASRSPERGLASAHRLGEIAPGAGHLVHMPAHIYLRLGMYHDASLVNEKAIAADRSYATQCSAQGYYPKLYVPHNIHFLWYCQMMEGRSEDAMESARKTMQFVTQGHPCAVQATEQAPLPLLTMVRFGQWDPILQEPRPGADKLYSTAIWHFARGLALTAKGQVDQAEQERAAIESIRRGERAATLDEPFFPGTKVVLVAEKTLAGEIAARRGQHEQARSLLEEAVRAEDDLPYMEPPYWFFPVRQSLGAALLNAGRPAEAEHVYRQDLERHPENGWSLFGLLASLREQGKTGEAAQVQERFKRAWQYADVTPTDSRF